MMSVYKTIHHCLDKPAYPTKGEAIRAMYKMMIAKEFFKPTLNAYACLFHPSHWHYGNSNEESR